MPQISRRSYADYDTDDSLDEQLPKDPTMAGLPETWRHYGWAAAATFFACIGIVESMTSGVLLSAATGLTTHFGNEIWALMAMLMLCIGFFQFWNRRKPKLSHPPVPSVP